MSTIVTGITSAMQIAARYDEASSLFTAALHAIRDAEHAGRIDADVAKLRRDWLNERFGGAATVDRQIAVCRVILRVCRNNNEVQRAQDD